jgi:hypothetical protein
MWNANQHQRREELWFGTYSRRHWLLRHCHLRLHPSIRLQCPWPQGRSYIRPELTEQVVVSNGRVRSQEGEGGRSPVQRTAKTPSQTSSHLVRRILATFVLQGATSLDVDIKCISQQSHATGSLWKRFRRWGLACRGASCLAWQLSKGRKGKAEKSGGQRGVDTLGRYAPKNQRKMAEILTQRGM